MRPSNEFIAFVAFVAAAAVVYCVKGNAFLLFVAVMWVMFSDWEDAPARKKATDEVGP